MIDWSSPETPPTSGGNVTMPDWQMNTTPTGFNSPRSWADGINMSAPSSGPSFNVEHPVIDPQDIFNGMKALGHSVDYGMGVLKQLPGIGSAVTAAGDVVGGAIGAVGSAIHNSPLQPLEQAGQAGTSFIGSLVEDTLRSVVGRVGAVAGEVGKTFDSNNQDPLRFLDAPFRIAGAAVLGKTGASAFDFGSTPNFDNLGQDLKDTISVVGVIPALKGIGMLGRSTEGVGALNVFRGVAKALQTTEGASLATKIGQYAGRTSIGLSGLGLAADYALPKLAPDKPWAAEIMNNRVVADDSPWRFAWEAATTLPLDLFQLAKMAGESKVAQFAQDAAFGPSAKASQIRWGDEAIQRAIDSGILTDTHVNYFDDYAARQFAEKKLVDTWNVDPLNPKAETIKDLPWTQSQASQTVNQTVSQLREKMGEAKFWQAAEENAGGEFTGFRGLDTPSQMQQWRDYADLAMEYEARSPGMTVQVASDLARATTQAPSAYDYLLDIKNSGREFNQAARADFANRYPAVATQTKNMEGDLDFLIARVQHLGTGTSGELPSLRAQLREAEARLADTASESYSGSLSEFENRGIDLQKAVDDLRNQVVQHSTPNIGAMESQLDVLNRRIIAGEDLAKERSDLMGELSKAREQIATNINNQIKTIQDSLYARQDELLTNMGISGATQADMLSAVNMESQKLQAQLKDLTNQYFAAKMAGSRWELGYNRSEPIMRLVDQTGLDMTRGEKNALQNVFTSLFGGIPNKDLAFQAYHEVQTELGSAGNTPESIQKYMDNLKSWIEANTITFKSGFRVAPYGTVYQLPTWVLNNLAKANKALDWEGLTAPEGKTIAEIFYRAYPGPLKIAGEALGGDRVGQVFDKVPYSAAVQNISRSMFPMFKFFLSTRFLVLNMQESNIIKFGLGGGRATGELAPDDPFVRMAAKLLGGPGEGSRRFAPSFEPPGAAGNVSTGNSSSIARNIAKLAYSSRADNIVTSLLDSIATQPAMQDFMKEFGTRDNWYQAMSDLMDHRQAIADGRVFYDESSRDLSNAIEDLKLKLNGESGNDMLVRGEMADKQAELTRMNIEHQAAEDENGRWLAANEKYRPLLDAVRMNEFDTIMAAKKTLLGNPDRSAAERVMNSYLLYWPLSYQLKATKILAEFMTSRAFGFPTGSSGGLAWSQIRDQHMEKMQTDPKYADFFDKNKHLLSLLEYEIPITPESLGLRLSPFVGAPAHLIEGKKQTVGDQKVTINPGPVKSYSTAPGTQSTKQYTAKNFIDDITNQGPLHDKTLFEQLVTEQAKPGGIYHQLLGGQ